MYTYQSLDTAKIKVQKHFKQYPDASISAIFRDLRSSSAYSSIGDFPILALIVCTVSSMGIDIKTPAIKRAMRYSKELSGKRYLLSQLINLQLTIRNSAQMPVNRRNKLIMTTLLSYA